MQQDKVKQRPRRRIVELSIDFFERFFLPKVTQKIHRIIICKIWSIQELQVVVLKNLDHFVQVILELVVLLNLLQYSFVIVELILLKLFYVHRYRLLSLNSRNHFHLFSFCFFVFHLKTNQRRLFLVSNLKNWSESTCSLPGKIEETPLTMRSLIVMLKNYLSEEKFRWWRQVNWSSVRFVFQMIKKSIDESFRLFSFFSPFSLSKPKSIRRKWLVRDV